MKTRQDQTAWFSQILQKMILKLLLSQELKEQKKVFLALNYLSLYL